MGRLTEGMDEQTTKPLTIEDMRQWCEDRNFDSLAPRLGWWWFVRIGDDGRSFIFKHEGAQGRELRRMLEGWTPDYMGWTEERLADETEKLRRRVRFGMTEERFRTLPQPDGTIRYAEELR